MNTPAPAKQSNTLFYILLGVAAIMLICLCCAVFSYLPTSSASSDTPPSIFTTDLDVKYVITGSARSALVTSTNATGGTEQNNVSIPWNQTMRVPVGSWLSIVAQNNGTGSITCEIWIDGQKIKTSTSTAQYGIVTCTDFAH